MEEDIRLIKGCQSGEKEAFQELIGKYHPYVYKFLARLSENETLAEDLTQETFIKIIRSIERFDVGGKAKFSTYILTVAKHCYIDYLRKEKRFMDSISLDESFDIQDASRGPEDVVVENMYGSDIMKNLDSLSEEQRIVIKMKYIEGLTLKEIGETLGIEPKTIKSRIHNGIVKLRKMFEREEG